MKQMHLIIYMKLEVKLHRRIFFQVILTLSIFCRSPGTKRTMEISYCWHYYFEKCYLW